MRVGWYGKICQVKVHCNYWCSSPKIRMFSAVVKRPVCQRVSWNCFVQLKWKLSKVSDENSLVWPILVVNGFGEANLLQGCTPSYAHQLSSDLLALPNEWWIVLFLFFHILPINTYYNGWLAHKWWIGILCYFIFSYIYIYTYFSMISPFFTMISPSNTNQRQQDGPLWSAGNGRRLFSSLRSPRQNERRRVSTREKP